MYLIDMDRKLHDIKGWIRNPVPPRQGIQCLYPVLELFVFTFLVTCLFFAV